MTLLAGCWEDPVRETVTVDLREAGRVGLAVAIELESASDLQRSPPARRLVEQTAFELIEGRHGWNDRFAALDCDVESGGWRKEQRELRRYELAAECADPSAFGALLSDRQLVAELAWDESGGVLRLVPVGGGAATRAERQRVGRGMSEFADAYAEYVDAGRAVDRRAVRDRRRGFLLWSAVVAEADVDKVPQLTRAERADAERLLDAIGRLIAVFFRDDAEAEPLDAVARRVFDPLPRALEIAPPPGARLDVDGFVPAGEGRWALPPRGFDGVLTAFAGRWFEPDPALTLLRQLRSDREVPVDLEPFLAGSIVRDAGDVDRATLRTEIESAMVPPGELRFEWRLHRPANPDAEGEAPAVPPR